MRPRRFLPRDAFDLRSASRDDFGRGEDRLLAAARTRFGLREPVGDRRPNRPDDVATVERLLNRVGQPPFGADREPTGLFSVPLRDSIRRFQRGNDLRDDGIVEPDGETLRAMAAESVQSLTARIDSLREQIRQLGDEVEELSRQNDELNARKERLNAERRALQEALEGAGVSALGAAARGAPPVAIAGAAAIGGAQAGLEELRRVQDQIEEINGQIQQNVDEIRFKTEFSERLQTDVSALIRERDRLRER